MPTDKLILTIVIGLVTYALRAIPFFLATRRSSDTTTNGSTLTELLNLAGPALIAALLALAVVPAPAVPERSITFLRSLLALAVVALVYRRVQHLGLLVLLGVLVYGLLLVFMPS